MRRILLLTVALIVYGSLYPWHFRVTHGASPFAILLHSWPDRIDLWALRDAILNIVLYLPLGFTAAASMRRSPKVVAFGLASLGGLTLSVAMELLQVYVPGRVCSLADVLTNAVGACLGAALGVIFAKRSKRLGRFEWAAIPASTVFLGALWVAYRLYPFFPVFGRTRILRAFETLAHGTARPVEIWMQAAEWVALAAILRFAWPKLRIGWLAVLMLIIPLQAFVLDRAVTLEEVIGAAVALGICALVNARTGVFAAAGILASAIVLRELSPFHLLARPGSFLWIPFSGTFGSNRDTSVVIILGKGFDYGAMIWLLRRAGAPFWPAAIAMACVLFALEWFQRLLPGRVPESTDAVLTLLLAVALWRLDRERHD